jgi:hypothetical protein
MYNYRELFDTIAISSLAGPSSVSAVHILINNDNNNKINSKSQVHMVGYVIR